MGMKERTTAVAKSLKKRQAALQQTYVKRTDKFVEDVEKVLKRVRTAKNRQKRHIVCFTLGMVDVCVTSVWIGASPSTFYYYYSLKIWVLVTCRAIWYRWINAHLFLMDLCYIVNGVILLHLWFFPESTFLNHAAQGATGMLSLAVPLFRNSFVPHSVDKLTSVHLHVSPVLMVYCFRHHLTAEQQAYYNVSKEFTLQPAFIVYIMWACGYHSFNFIFGKDYIKRIGASTLFEHMADSGMGLRAKFPAIKVMGVDIRYTRFAEFIFILGHFCIFLLGAPYPYFSHNVEVCCIMFMVLWAFYNGAVFYITYFWKVYNTQIQAFEMQLNQAQLAATNVSTVDVPDDSKRTADDENLVSTDDEDR